MRRGFTDLEGRLAAVLVDDAEGAQVGAQGADLGRHVDDELVLVDQAVVAGRCSGRKVQSQHSIQSYRRVKKKNKYSFC